MAGAVCLPDPGDGEERKECEAVCAIEGQCAELGRSEADCLASLCDEEGFRRFEDDPDAATPSSVDLQDLSFIECAQAAEDCGALALCSCPDACTRVDDCSGSPDATCVDTCEGVLAQDPSLYLENRCKMESTCADLAACGAVSG